MSVLHIYGKRSLLLPITHANYPSREQFTIIAPITRPCGMWHQLAAKHEGQFQQKAPIYDLNLAMGAMVARGNNVDGV